MTLEQMAYKMQPAGHEARNSKRKYSKSSSKLARAFEKWLHLYKAGFPSQAGLASSLLKKIEPDIQEAHALIMQYQDHPNIHEAGRFLSEIYNRSKNQVIIYDLDTDIPVNCVGLRLDERKILINTGRAGEYFGFQAGTIINYGETGTAPAAHAKKFVNYGKTRLYAAAHNVIVANLGTIIKSVVDSKFGNGAGCILDFSSKVCTYGKAAPGGIFISVKDDLEYDDNAHSDYEESGGESIVVATANCGFTVPPFARAKVFLWPVENKAPQLMPYLRSLRESFEKGRNDYSAALAALETLGPNPMAKVKSDIEGILGGGDGKA